MSETQKLASSGIDGQPGLGSSQGAHLEVLGEGLGGFEYSSLTPERTREVHMSNPHRPLSPERKGRGDADS